MEDVYRAPKLASITYAQSFEDNQHLVANGYANAWYIPVGNSEFTIYFQPQSLFYYGSLISIFALLAIGVFVSRAHAMKRHSEKPLLEQSLKETDKINCLQLEGRMAFLSVYLVLSSLVLLLVAASFIIAKNSFLAQAVGIISFFTLSGGLLSRFGARVSE